MLWNEMKMRIETATKNWEIMKADISAKQKKDEDFLSKSYLVVCNRSVQVEVKQFVRDPKTVADANPFLLKKGANKGFFRLCRELGRLEARSKQLQGQTGKADLARKVEISKSNLKHLMLRR